MNEKIAAAIRERAPEEKLSCGNAFRIAEELNAKPLAVGETANEMDVQIVHCQLGLFGYTDQDGIVEVADDVSPDVEQAIREGLIVGRLPCAVAWAIAARFGIPKTHVANAAEALGIRIGQCQLGTF